MLGREEILTWECQECGQRVDMAGGDEPHVCLKCRTWNGKGTKFKYIGVNKRG